MTQFQQLSDQSTVRRRLGLPMEAFVAAAVGRPRPVKGYHFLVEAWRDVIAQLPQARLAFVGEGPDRWRLEQQAQRYHLQDAVFFLGEWGDIPQILPAFDLLVIPSLYEGMPNVALEAMASGLPVVATAVGGTPEVVINEETGLLIPPADPTALAQALITLLPDPERRRQMGRCGRERVQEKFLQTQTVQMTETLYETLLSQQ